MLRFLRLAPAALFVLAAGSSSSAFGQAGAQGDAPSEVPPPSAVPPPEALPPPPPAAKGTPPLKVDASNGSSIKFGLLLQPQFQMANSGAAALSGYTSNLFLRRARLLFGGNLFGVVDYFVDTEFANLFIANTVTTTDPATMMMTTTTSKVTPGMNIQDAFATAKVMGDMVKVDAGYMLPPLAHNAVQGAGTLLGWDYFRFSFRHDGVFGTTTSPVGRDLGVQLRGLIANKVEYRLGLFQGLRKNQTATEVAGKNMFRVAGRLQVNLLDAETGFFYGGTYLGTKKVLSVGLSGDLQDNYKYFAGDIFADLPVGPGVVTAQLNVAHWNGGGFVALPSQTAIMGEAGYLISDLHLTPIVRVEHLKGTAGMPATETRISGGVAFWPYGHNSNLKLFFTSVDTTGAARKVNQINLQWQVYYF